MFLHESWPWCKGQSSVLTVAVDGTAKVGTHVGVITPIFSGLQGGGEGILFFLEGEGGSGWYLYLGNFFGSFIFTFFKCSHVSQVFNQPF